jgi:hypothetical protein
MLQAFKSGVGCIPAPFSYTFVVVFHKFGTGIVERMILLVIKEFISRIKESVYTIIHIFN